MRMKCFSLILSVIFLWVVEPMKWFSVKSMFFLNDVGK